MDNLKLTTVEGVLYDEDDAKDTPWFMVKEMNIAIQMDMTLAR